MIFNDLCGASHGADDDGVDDDVLGSMFVCLPAEGRIPTKVAHRDKPD